MGAHIRFQTKFWQKSGGNHFTQLTTAKHSTRRVMPRHFVKPVAALGSDASDPDGPLAKLKTLFEKYGILALGFHFTVFSMTFGTSLALLSSGLRLDYYLPDELKQGLPFGAPNLAIAYLITEATGPFRTLLTLGAVPVVGKKLDELKSNKAT